MAGSGDTDARDKWAPIEALAKTIDAAAITRRTYRPEELLTTPLLKARGKSALPSNPTAGPRAGLEETGPAVEPALAFRTEAPAEAESFEILEPIGQGGMGIVFRAVQRSLCREVALKQVRPGFERTRDAFLAEALITARLDHASIVPVHLLGRTGKGAPLLAMKLVKGTSWGELLHSPKGERLPLEEHLRILLAACNAVGFAHRQGFLHRDLKPDNVMVGEFGQVFVMDWGIAVGLDRGAASVEESAAAASRLPDLPILRAGETQNPAGTPVYMAPELALGEGARQDERTDIYLLGACLHEVLTGTPRHPGATVLEVLEDAVESPPFVYDDAIPRELGAIVNRATAKEPAFRYPSVEAFKEAIEGFLEHRQAYAMAEEGHARVEELCALLAAPRAAIAEEQAEQARAIHRCHTEARFAFEHALDLWGGAEEARAGLHEAHRLLLEHAIFAEDLALATRILPECDTPEMREKVAALRARALFRARELEALRETARRLDWSVIAPSLGTVFIGAGLLGGAGVVLTRLIVRHAAAHAAPLLGLLWVLVALGIGVLARVKLQGRGAPASLRSPQVVGTWAAVAAGCLINGPVVRLAIMRLEARWLFYETSSSAIMVGIGLTAMALQTRRWLLLPAAAFFAGAVVIGVLPDLGLEIFGGLWVVTLVGVGVTLKLGGTLGEPSKAPDDG